MVRMLKNLFNSGPSAQAARPARRAPRIFIAGNTVQFKSAKWEGSAIPLYNISATGVAFRQGFFKDLPNVNDVIAGAVTIDKDEFEVELKVVHLTPPLVGCAFINHQETLAQSLNEKFEFELSAHSLVKMKPGILKPVDEGTPYFYFGKQQEELYFVRASNVITQFNICFEGIYIEGGRNRELKMGMIAEQDMRTAPKGYTPTARMEVAFFEEIKPDFIDKAKAFLRNIQWLSGDNVKLITKHLEECLPQRPS